MRVLYRSISPMIHTIRTSHRKDFNDRFLTWAQENKVSSSAIRKGAYRFFFNDVDYLNEEEVARIDKMKIEAFRLQIDTLTEMFLNNNMGAGMSSEDLAKRFADHFNMGWLYGEE